MLKDKSGLFSGTSGSKTSSSTSIPSSSSSASTASPVPEASPVVSTQASSGKLAGIQVSLPIGTYDTGIKFHKQNEHIPGTKEFKPGKSEIHIPLSELQDLVNTKAGNGFFIPGTTKERMDFGKIIGVWVDAKTGVSQQTPNGIINYSKKGTHVVPARP